MDQTLSYRQAATYSWNPSQRNFHHNVGVRITLLVMAEEILLLFIYVLR